MKSVLRRDARKRFQRDLPQRTSGGGQRDPSDRVQILTDEALPERVVLAVDRAEAFPRPAGEAADKVAGGDEHFLIRERDALACLERGDGRAERRDTGRRDEDEVGVGIRRERDERVRAKRRACGRKLQRELAQLVVVVVRAKRDDAKALGLRTHDIECLASDRACRAQDRQTDRSGHQPIIPSAPRARRQPRRTGRP